MIIQTGCGGVLKFGTPNNLQYVDEVLSWTVSIDPDTKEFRPVGQYYSVRRTDVYNWSLSVNGHWLMFDPGQNAMSIGQCIDFELWPIGEGAGKPNWSGTVYVDSLNTSGSADEVIPFDASMTGASILRSENIYITDERNDTSSAVGNVQNLFVAQDSRTITWDAVSGATGYELRYQNGNNTDWITATKLTSLPVSNNGLFSPIDLNEKTLLIKAIDQYSVSAVAATLYVSIIPLVSGEWVLSGELGETVSASRTGTLYAGAFEVSGELGETVLASA